MFVSKDLFLDDDDPARPQQLPGPPSAGAAGGGAEPRTEDNVANMQQKLMDQRAAALNKQQSRAGPGMGGGVREAISAWEGGDGRRGTCTETGAGERLLKES